jgi:hypothetical protein
MLNPYLSPMLSFADGNFFSMANPLQLEVVKNVRQKALRPSTLPSFTFQVKALCLKHKYCFHLMPVIKIPAS